MSIYGTSLSFADDDHTEACGRWVPLGPSDDRYGHVAVYTDGRRFGLDTTLPCTCRSGPIAYQGSHILPNDGDPRAGTFDLGTIAGFITRDGRPATDPYGETVHPWLRVSVNQETVVLDRAQVRELYHTLADWLMRSQPDQDPDSIPADIPANATEGSTTPMKTIEEYAAQLVADGAQSHAEDDLNEDGDIADGDHQQACDLAQSIAEAIRKDPAGAVEFARQAGVIC